MCDEVTLMVTNYLLLGYHFDTVSYCTSMAYLVLALLARASLPHFAADRQQDKPSYNINSCPYFSREMDLNDWIK